MGANRIRRDHYYLPFGERDQAIPWRGIHQREITGVQEFRSTGVQEFRSSGVSGVSGDRSRNQIVLVLVVVLPMDTRGKFLTVNVL
jgi:hypothetical protein